MDTVNSSGAVEALEDILNALAFNLRQEPIGIFEQRNEGICFKLPKDTIACFLRIIYMVRGGGAAELGPMVMIQMICSQEAGG